jgi:hypothetical protein
MSYCYFLVDFFSGIGQFFPVPISHWVKERLSKIEMFVISGFLNVFQVYKQPSLSILGSTHRFTRPKSTDRT